jgi:hypothetical protein
MKEQQYFYPEEAAKKLGITLSELCYEVKEGVIRLAVDVPAFVTKRIVRLGNLSQKNQRLCSISDTHQLLMNWEAHKDSQTRDAPRFLYLEVVGTAIRWTEEPPHEFKSITFETFEGESVVLLNLEGFPEFVYLGSRNTYGFYSDSVLTLEELSRLTQVSLEHPVKKFETPKLTPLHLEKLDSASEAIVELGNAFQEKYGKAPTPTALWRYMLERAAKPGDGSLRYQVIEKPNGRTGYIQIEGVQMSKEAFKKRLKNAKDGGKALGIGGED